MRLARDEEGQAIILVAAASLVLVLALAVAIGAGQLFTARRAAQDAADAAALAGAIAMHHRGSTADVEDAACADAARNGYGDCANTGSTLVTVYRPPRSGPHTGDDLFVEVIIRVPARGVFLLGGPATLAVRAVAGVASEQPPAAVYTLSPSGTALSTSGGSTITARGGDILVASRDLAAATTDGSSRVVVAAPNAMRVAGGTAGTGFTPPAQTMQTVPSTDPFPTLQLPDTSAMPTRVCCTPLLLPGVYPGGIDGRGALVLQPGVYVLKGGGLSLSTGAASITGSGVLIFNTTSTYPAPGGTCGPIDFRSQDFDLSAATSGPYRNLVIWQDPACPEALRSGGNTRARANGTIYLPNAGLELVGSTGMVLNSAIVSRSLTLRSSADLIINFDQRANLVRLVGPGLSE